MKELFVLIAHLLTTLITLARPGGVREVAAESMALKLQLVIVHRTRKRAPPMTPWDRLVLGLCALWIATCRRKKVSVVFRPSTFQRFHDTLVRCKYRLLFGAKGRRKPGPKGPEKELIEAVVAMKRQNPRFGCLKIAQEITMLSGWRSTELRAKTFDTFLFESSTAGRRLPRLAGPCEIEVYSNAR